MCGLRRKQSVRSLRCLKVLSAIPQIYPFWLLLSVGIFTGLGIVPLLWSSGAAPNDWVSHVTASARWNCEEHGMELELPLDVRSPLEHYKIATSVGGPVGSGGEVADAMSTATRLRLWSRTYSSLVTSHNASGGGPDALLDAYAGANALPQTWQRACKCFFGLDPDAELEVNTTLPIHSCILFLPGMAPYGIIGVLGVLLLWYAQAVMCCAAGCCCGNPLAMVHDDEAMDEGSAHGAMAVDRGSWQTRASHWLSPNTARTSQSL